MSVELKVVDETGKVIFLVDEEGIKDAVGNEVQPKKVKKEKEEEDAPTKD